MTTQELDWVDSNWIHYKPGLTVQYKAAVERVCVCVCSVCENGMPSGRSLHTTSSHGSHETSCTWSPSQSILHVCWEGNTSITMLCYSKHYILRAYGFKCHFSFSFTTFLQAELEFINKLRLYSKHLLWHLDCILNKSVLGFAIFVALAITVHCKCCTSLYTVNYFRSK